MKAAAFSGIRDVHNYDLKDSQVYGLIQAFELGDFNTSWLVSYGNTPNNKEIYASFAGISSGAWKHCLLALIMGATLPKTVSRADKRKNSILSKLYNEADGDTEKISEMLKGFVEGVSGLIPDLMRWHDWLLDGYIPKFKKNCRAGSFIVNKCGKRLELNKLPRTRHATKGIIAAFLLQGQESCFIHHLTLLDSYYGYKVMSNEHDGLITLGEIPSAAVEEAASLSGLANAHLVEKDFVKRDKQAKDGNFADEQYQRFSPFIVGQSCPSDSLALAS